MRRQLYARPTSTDERQADRVDEIKLAQNNVRSLELFRIDELLRMSHV